MRKEIVEEEEIHRKNESGCFWDSRTGNNNRYPHHDHAPDFTPSSLAPHLKEQKMLITLECTQLNPLPK